LFSRLSLAYLNIENIHWIWLIIFYLVLGFIIWRLQESQKLRFLKYRAQDKPCFLKLRRRSLKQNVVFGLGE